MGNHMEEEAHLCLLTPTHYPPPPIANQLLYSSESHSPGTRGLAIHREHSGRHRSRAKIALRHGAESVSVIGSSADIAGL